MFSGTGSNDIFSPFTGPASITIGLPICCGGAHVDVGGVECFSTSVHDPPCGTMTLMTSEGLPPRPADWPVTEDFVSTVPFTAIGHLDVGGGFDIVGDGILAGTVCGRNTTCDTFTTPILRHAFSVPEASTLLLLVTSLGVLVVLQRQRAARSVSKAEPFAPWAPTYRALRTMVGERVGSARTSSWSRLDLDDLVDIDPDRTYRTRASACRTWWSRPGAPHGRRRVRRDDWRPAASASSRHNQCRGRSGFS
jgi:hypothetical protein